MSLEARLAAGETVCSAWSCVPDALTVEVHAAQAFDAVTLDMQHGGHNEDSVLRSIVPVMRAQKPALVRIPVGRFDMASRALDFGAEGVIAPMVNSIEDARRFGAAMSVGTVARAFYSPLSPFRQPLSIELWRLRFSRRSWFQPSGRGDPAPGCRTWSDEHNAD